MRASSTTRRMMSAAVWLFSGLVACQPATSDARPVLQTSCFGYVAEFALVDQPTAGGADPWTMSNVHWQVKLTGPPSSPPMWPPKDGVQLAIDTFLVRDEQAARVDIMTSRTSGVADTVTLQGAVRLSDEFGPPRPGDDGRIQLWVQTPSGTLGLPRFAFSVRVFPDRVEAGSIWTEGESTCTASP